MSPSLQQTASASQSQVQQQTQKQVQQQIRKLAILEEPIAAMRTRIRDSILDNPALDADSFQDESIDALRTREEKALKDQDGDLVEPEKRDALFEEELFFGDGNNEYNPDAEKRRQFFLDSIPARESLQAHLLAQVDSANVPETLRELVVAVIGSLNDRGFFVGNMAEIAQPTFSPVADVERALEIVQTFDPLGVGARDARELLLLQLPSVAKTPAECLAKRILRSEEGVRALEAGNLDRLTEVFSVGKGEVKAALDVIRALDPNPCSKFDWEEPVFIEPDLLVVWEDGRWKACLNEKVYPVVRYSEDYCKKAEAAQIRAKAPDATQEDKDTACVMHAYMETAKELIDGVADRKKTLLRVAEIIVEKQMGFFERGPSALVRLRLQDVAKPLKRDESTISRTVADKFLQFKGKNYSLKSFFVDGLLDPNGCLWTQDRLVAQIKAFVEGEDPAKPLSDDALMLMVKRKCNLNIARRTIAKYRSIAGIPNSQKRHRRPSDPVA